jgi:hypothetical protein
MKANYCTNCGAALSGENQFCGYCGTPKGTTALVVEEVPATIGRNNHTDARLNWLVAAGVLIGGVLLVGFLVSTGSESNSAPSVATTSVVASSVAPTGVPAEVIPPSEKAFISTITSFISLYNGADTEVRKTDVRFQRRQAIASCFSGLGLEFDGWVGQVKDLRTESDGEAYVSIRLRGTDVEIKTWNNSLSDTGDHTMIRRSDALYTSLRDIKEGDEVTVAGSFIEADKDYIKEASLTEEGSMTDPEFIVRFSEIRKGVRPLENPGAAQPVTPIVQEPAPPETEQAPAAGSQVASPAQPTATEPDDPEARRQKAVTAFNTRADRPSNVYASMDGTRFILHNSAAGLDYLTKVIEGDSKVGWFRTAGFTKVVVTNGGSNTFEQDAPELVFTDSDITGIEQTIKDYYVRRLLASPNTSKSVASGSPTVEAHMIKASDRELNGFVKVEGPDGFTRPCEATMTDATMDATLQVQHHATWKCSPPPTTAEAQ